ncbi:MAG TPA: hypothetical protein VFH42_05635 [Sporolactobacillaceae bacterium]|nr:hypothetical protein [Sporolactobacillaceae bacterium]
MAVILNDWFMKDKSGNRSHEFVFHQGYGQKISKVDLIWGNFI